MGKWFALVEVFSKYTGLVKDPQWSSVWFVDINMLLSLISELMLQRGGYLGLKYEEHRYILRNIRHMYESYFHHKFFYGYCEVYYVIYNLHGLSAKRSQILSCVVQVEYQLQGVPHVNHFLTSVELNLRHSTNPVSWYLIVDPSHMCRSWNINFKVFQISVTSW